MDNFDNTVYSVKVPAGRRTYFFDLKKTSQQKWYISISETKKNTNFDTGETTFERHRLFLYEEDFENFLDALRQVIEQADLDK